MTDMTTRTAASAKPVAITTMRYHRYPRTVFDAFAVWDIEAGMLDADQFISVPPYQHQLLVGYGRHLADIRWTFIEVE